MQSFSIQFPEPMVQKMNEIVSKGTKGYGSRAELIRDCVRKYIEEK
jgi:metal-responsive CopG/Arc/MetJ family transcriptional regulator